MYRRNFDDGKQWKISNEKHTNVQIEFLQNDVYVYNAVKNNDISYRKGRVYKCANKSRLTGL